MKSVRRLPSHKKGFTIIELLVVILILSVLMAVAMPLYLEAISRSEVTTCRSNMYSIAHAETAYRARCQDHTYTTNLIDLKSDLGANPACPAGGNYSVDISDGHLVANNGNLVQAGGIVIKCSAPGHGVFAPGVDSE